LPCKHLSVFSCDPLIFFSSFQKQSPLSRNAYAFFASASCTDDLPPSMEPLNLNIQVISVRLSPSLAPGIDFFFASLEGSVEARFPLVETPLTFFPSPLNSTETGRFKRARNSLLLLYTRACALREFPLLAPSPSRVICRKDTPHPDYPFFLFPDHLSLLSNG